MRTCIIHEKDLDSYYKVVLADENTSIEECKLKIALLGYNIDELDLEEAKTKTIIGDCILIQYENMFVPFQIIHKSYNEDGSIKNCFIQSYYLLEKHIFDDSTNVWKDSELRSYLNHEFKKKFTPKFIDNLKEHELHTSNYTTIDTFWIPSHENTCYSDVNGTFNPNDSDINYDYYKSFT